MKPTTSGKICLPICLPLAEVRSDSGNERAFIRRVMENRLVTIIRARHAGCRDYRRTLSGDTSENAGPPLIQDSALPLKCMIWKSIFAGCGTTAARVGRDCRVASTSTSDEMVGLLGISRSTLIGVSGNARNRYWNRAGPLYQLSKFPS